MKIILTEHKNFVEVLIRDGGGINIFCYIFDNKKLAEAFCSGFYCARSVANSLIQDLPMGYEKT